MNSKIKKLPQKFVGLHSHSGFSTFDGLGYPSEHMDFCIENGLNAWSLTDHGHMNGFGYAYLHAKKLREKGVNFKFIPGCEMYVHPNLDLWRSEYELRRARKRGWSVHDATRVPRRDVDSRTKGAWALALLLSLIGMGDAQHVVE